MLLYCAICMFHVTCRDLGHSACIVHAWNSHSHMQVLSTLLGESQALLMHVAELKQKSIANIQISKERIINQL